MPALRQHAPSGLRATDLNGGLGRFRLAARLYVYFLLGRVADERRRCDLFGLPHSPKLAKIISTRMNDLDLGIGARDLDLVITLFHVSREIGQRKLPI